MDMKTTFLHGDLKQEIYMKPLEGFIVKGKKDLVSKMNKSLYGLNQYPMMWEQKFDTYILVLGSVRSKVDYVVLYVNGMVLVVNNMEVSKDVKS